MKKSYEENWKLVRELRAENISFKEIKKIIEYGGTIKKLMEMYESPYPSSKESKKVKDLKRKKDRRGKILSYFGGVCKRCGFSDYRALQIDHVNEEGHREVKAIGNYAIYKRLTVRIENGEDIKDYQLLCANCNWIKRFENNENPNVPYKS